MSVIIPGAKYSDSDSCFSITMILPANDRLMTYDNIHSKLTDNFVDVLLMILYYLDGMPFYKEENVQKFLSELGITDTYFEPKSEEEEETIEEKNLPIKLKLVEFIKLQKGVEEQKEDYEEST
jgi:hypothetical protein